MLTYSNFDKFLLELNKLLTVAPDFILTGGYDFTFWAAEVLKLCLVSHNVYSSGGMVVPQLGEDAGKTLCFVVNNLEKSDCISPQAIKDITTSFGENIPREPQRIIIRCSHPSHINIVFVPISLGYIRPVGYFWCVVENNEEPIISSVLEFAANIISINVKSEKVCCAMDHLSKPVWINTLTTIGTTRKILKSCLSALSCSAVIFWRVDHLKENLKTIAVIDSTGSHLNVDMKLGQGVCGKCAEDDKVILIDDLLDTNELNRFGVADVYHINLVKQRGWRSAIFIPIDVGGQNYGVLGVYGLRPRGFSHLDQNIALAFAQRLATGYIHAQRIEELTEMEGKISNEAPAIEAGMLAMEGVHDADDALFQAQGQLSLITERVSSEYNKKHPIYKAALAAKRHVEQAKKLTRDLRNRAKIKELRHSRADLRLLLEDFIQNSKPEADRIKTKIHLTCPENIIIRVDKDKMKRVFQNLFSNSFYFLETDRKGGDKIVSINVNIQDNLIKISFKDNGPGIAPHNLNRIFGYFYTSKGKKGMGFGLPIAKAIVEAHEGSINVTSKWGFETEILITLPLTHD